MELGAGRPGGLNPALSWMPDQESRREPRNSRSAPPGWRGWGVSKAVGVWWVRVNWVMNVSEKRGGEK